MKKLILLILAAILTLAYSYIKPAGINSKSELQNNIGVSDKLPAQKPGIIWLLIKDGSKPAGAPSFLHNYLYSSTGQNGC